jgi:uncharacterized RDD family membrane protein YckC
MTSTIAYARFSRRLRALLLDALLFGLTFYIGATVIGSLSMPDSARRVAWLAVLLLIILYEPVLVSAIGGTIGHRLTNLRVVDDRSNGNIGLIKALVRSAVKAMLGWLSFLAMTVTRRHQAVHDVVTRSTVQIRDVSKASAAHFVTERGAT